MEKMKGGTYGSKGRNESWRMVEVETWSVLLFY